MLAFTRDSGLTSVTNLSAAPVPLPEGRVLLSSGPLDDGLLPADTTVWVTPS
ncbi:hypothetical protein GCM10020001_064930 [Nonomuraea salmonea]